MPNTKTPTLEPTADPMSVPKGADFRRQALRYIVASRDGRLIVRIGKVAPSGMSRTMRFVEMNAKPGRSYQIINFFALFDALGYPAVNDDYFFRVKGGGMDIVLHTHERVLHKLSDLGFITTAEASALADIEPHVI